MEEFLIKKIKELYGEEWILYGPYLGKDSRRRVVLYNGKQRKTRQYAKLKLEAKLGRLLVDKEEVDHIDGNTLNDNYCNLQLLTGNANRKKAIESKFGPRLNIKCENCKKNLLISKSRKFGNLKFCSSSCRSKFYFYDLGTKTGRGR